LEQDFLTSSLGSILKDGLYFVFKKWYYRRCWQKQIEALLMQSRQDLFQRQM